MKQIKIVSSYPYWRFLYNKEMVLFHSNTLPRKVAKVALATNRGAFLLNVNVSDIYFPVTNHSTFGTSPPQPMGRKSGG